MIFNFEKWERIKNRREDAAQAYQVAGEDWRFERSSFEKNAGVFERNFHRSIPKYAEVSEAINLLRKMDPQDISAIDLKVNETLALVETGNSHHQQLTELLTKLLTMKRAEARKEQAAEAQENNTRCFSVLEEFARKHIKLRLSSGPTPVNDSPAAMDFYRENQ